MRNILLKSLLLLSLLGAWSAPAAATGYTQTKYPIVLVPGLFGFEKLAGVYDYFFLIPQELQSGGATVLGVNISNANSDVYRGEQMIQQLDTYRAIYGVQKFNLLTHSQGGFTARYVASVRPDLVASVFTTGTAHTGSKVADLVEFLAPEDSLVRSIVGALVNIFAKLEQVIALQSHDVDVVSAALQLTTGGATAFTSLHPYGQPAASCSTTAEVTAANGVRYYSAAGTKPFASPLDPADYFIGLLGGLVYGSTKNDGINSSCSEHWGAYLGDYPWNHFDEINQILGIRGLFAPSPLSFYRSYANRLKSKGL